jgi:hypothetical protein
MLSGNVIVSSSGNRGNKQRQKRDKRLFGDARTPCNSPLMKKNSLIVFDAHD